jgi:hypothetical protein
MNLLPDFMSLPRLAGDSRAVPATRQTILLQTFYPGLTPAGRRPVKAISMNLHIGTPDLSGRMTTDILSCRMNPAFRNRVGSTSKRRIV